MLFPQLGPQYYDEKNRGILSRMEAFYAESVTINQSFWAEADTDYRFYTGDQALWNDLYGNLPANRRRQFQFNRIMRIINMISGYQRRNRKSTIVTPVENGDAITADQFTKILLWSSNTEGILETISESFLSSLIAGSSLLHIWMDYRQDPINGNIRVDYCPYNSFLIDPYFKKTDLSDCNAIWKRTYITKREALALLPGHEDEVLGLYGNDSRDMKFQFMAESYNYGMRNLLTYDEFYYRDFRKQKLIVDTNTGETMEWKSEDNDNLKLFLQTYKELTVVDQEIPTHRVAIVLQGKVMYDGPNPNGLDAYPFVPVLAYYHPELPYFPQRIQGVVRGLRDAQYLYNRRRVIELDILESQITSGFKYKENALVNPKDVFLSGQGRGLALKEDAQMSDVEQIIAPQIPPSMIQLSELLGKEILEVSGANEELMGSAVDDKVGILAMLRQGAGLTTLQILFDNLDRAQKLLGQRMLELIQINFTPGKVKKILEGQNPSDQFYNKAFGRYDAVVEEGMNTTTQKQMQFAQMLQLREAGVPIPDASLIEACTLQNKQKILEFMQQQQQQQQQMQQMQLQSTLQEQQARTDLAKARAIADEGLGYERLSRVDENKAMAQERRAAAAKDEDIGILNKVRALKELETMDLEHLEKLLTLYQLSRGREEELKAQTQGANQPAMAKNQTP